ncbi:MAG: FumA C-terminus/TtdB family hydratase beta subunit [Clostridia bacterium]|nr:FumA C-terminus/TtdB family hydratase beta subunit [Clostridia bacterium]
MKKLTLPLAKQQIEELHAGDSVSLTGVILTARDEAHKEIFKHLDNSLPLPFELKNSVIYFAGPCPAKPDKASGSCGPTTSARMESFAPRMLSFGVSAFIGKGEMNEATREALKKFTGVYFAAIGGAGALYGNAIKKCECIAFPELLSEAVYRLEVENFPAVVAYDCRGGSIY